ncbi:MAG TPA: hypothetical protein DCP61_01280 [Treponema sp.]|nr:hypothetical protein [Treponema sp.]
MKINAKIAALTGAALVFGATSVFAQSTETTTTTTTTVTETAISEDADADGDVDYVGYEAEGEIEVEGDDVVVQGSKTDTVTKEYEGYLIVPVETTEETTYTTVIGQPKGRWSASDWFGGKFHFTNKLGSDIVKGRGALKDDDDRPATRDQLYSVELGKIYDELELTYEAKRLKFMLKPQVGISDASEDFWTGNANNLAQRNGLTNDDVSISWTDFDWYVEFLPFDMVGINLHHDMYTPGSYLPVADQNITGGNLSSEGLTIALYPVEKLRITATAPFDFDVLSGRDWINAEIEDETPGDPYGSASGYNNLMWEKNGQDEFKFNMGYGAEYTIGNFLTIGGTWKDILDSYCRQAGAYFSLIGIPHFTINLGYTWSQHSFKQGTVFDYWELDDAYGEYGKITGHHVVNLGVAAQFGRFNVALDGIYNIMKDQSVFDLYAGLGVGYDFIPGTLKFGLKGFGAFDFGTEGAENITLADGLTGIGDGRLAWDTDADSADILIGVSPWLIYTTGRHEFGASVVYEFQLNDVDNYHFKFPVYWKYTF